MALASVRYTNTVPNFDQTAQLYYYDVTFYGADVSADIAYGQQNEISVEASLTWNSERINVAILAAVAAKAAALGLTVAYTDIQNAIYKTKQPLLPEFSARRYSFQKDSGAVTTTSQVGVSGTLTKAGTASSVNDAGGQYIQYDSIAVLDSNCGWLFAGSGGTALQNMPRNAFVWKTPASIADYRCWIGMTSGATVINSDVPAVELAAFRYSTSFPDTYWTMCTSDGATQTEVATSVLVEAGTRYEMEIDGSVAGEVSFYINRVYMGTLTTNLPTSTAPLGQVLVGRTLLALTSKSILISHMVADSL